MKANSPFTSGSIHIGHVRSYAIADAYARFRRANGDAVLFTIGFDAHGLPAEQAAMRNREPPQSWVRRCRQQMESQLARMGFSFDWDRAFTTCEEDVYKWSQHLFLLLYEARLIRYEVGNVDWCECCQTTLAAMQAPNGRCWRCATPTTILRRPQWYLRFSSYIHENASSLSERDAWNRAAVSAQRGLCGRTDGAELEVEEADGRTFTVFTPHPDRIEQASFVMISPRHPEIDAWSTDEIVRRRVQALRSAGWKREARSAANIPVVAISRTVRLPGERSFLPVLISSAVDARYGPTAVLGMPASDRTDAIVAQRLGIAPKRGPLSAAGAPPLRASVRWRTHDFSIGRQRSWGTPIPVAHCERCGVVPRRVEELPVKLQAPACDRAGTSANDQLIRCPRCGKDARRETESLDAHFDGLWIWMPACVPRQARRSSMFDHPELRRWLPGNRHIYGSDCSVYTFDQRITAKALRDLGPLTFLDHGEPFKAGVMHGMVTHEGRKMSKHLGNSVDPDELVARFGADAVRLGMLYAAKPTRNLDWSEHPIERCHRFLADLWTCANRCFLTAPRPTAVTPPAADRDASRQRLYTDCFLAIRNVTAQVENSDLHKAVRSLIHLHGRILAFEAVERTPKAELEQTVAEATALTLLVQLLCPLAPHIAEELWLISRGDSPATVEEPGPEHIPWPEIDVWRRHAPAAPDGVSLRRRLRRNYAGASSAGAP